MQRLLEEKGHGRYLICYFECHVDETTRNRLCRSENLTANLGYDF